MTDQQDATLTARDGSTVKTKVDAFPNYPELLKTNDGRYWIADSPAIGYGESDLHYHEASPPVVIADA